jgi:hypothetical protein
MIELRYNGCADCLRSAKTLLAVWGWRNNVDYRVEFHSDHKDDPIYKKRPDYLKHFSGAIIYNTKTGAWIDLYNGGSNIISSDEYNRKMAYKLRDG